MSLASNTTQVYCLDANDPRGYWFMIFAHYKDPAPLAQSLLSERVPASLEHVSIWNWQVLLVPAGEEKLASFLQVYLQENQCIFK